MRLTAQAIIFAASLLCAVSAHALPSASGDDLDKLLADKGLLGQIDQVRQSVSHKASELVVNAMGFLGVPYKRGGNTAETGFDCSGFVRAMYEQSIGLILPRRAEQQAAATQNIDKNDLQPGDLVFFNTMKRAFSHVGIYVGDGKFIHSPRPGAEVRVESMTMAYWKGRFDGARRVASRANDGTTTSTPAQTQSQPAQALQQAPAVLQSQKLTQEQLFLR
ncbi:MAG: C40 family peptidase [Polaromonas sp.]|nr:C40 family peptidase [Polaromonas sp.]